jgi:ribosomal RNA-processing protein 12
LSKAGISQQQAQANVNFLKSQSESWLAVLFNVFSSVGRNARNTVGDVINVWASISDEKETSQAFHKVLELFKQSFGKSQPATGDHGNNEGSVTAMMQDILLILLPYLSVPDTQQLFNILLTKEVLSSNDNGVQKRGYKLLAKIMETNRIQIDAEEILRQLDGFTNALSAAAKKDRFFLLSQLVLKLPSSSMHVIPSIIPEAVLGTKEPSEKGRHAAFELVVIMGTKMSEGGVVKRSMMDGMDEDNESPGDAKASINEYMTMVAGGLAGATPHMISATITAISRLMFEFKDQISETMQTELLSTLIVFVTSNNREIVKSALGYIKLSIHTLPLELFKPHLPQLVPALLNWSHDHANHFKVKVRHIFERMMRRLSFEEIYQNVGGTDEARERGKVLLNIKKRKERAKKKKAAREDADNDEEFERPAGKQGAGDAFEDVLYGSESELEDSDDDDQPSASAPKDKEPQKKKGDRGGARLRMDDDDPMDLLEGAAARISNSKGGSKRKPGQDASRFKTDADTGKIRFDDSSDDEADDKAASTNVAGTAYREGITGVDGFTRGPNGRVKFNKDTKKRRREELDAGDGDVEMDDASGAKAKAQVAAKKKKQNIFGQEFKAKRAGGDVKKNGVEPYAYMPLNQAAKKKRGGSNKLGIASNR